MTVIQGKDTDSDKRSLTAKAVSQFVGSWQQGCEANLYVSSCIPPVYCIPNPKSKI